MKSNGNYDWTFSTIGGVTRVNITSGEDIAHLSELDPKLWSVLSCPVKGLELEEETLKVLDRDGDGYVHVRDVLGGVRWLKDCLKNLDCLLEGSDKLPLADFNLETEEGRTLHDSARSLLDFKDPSREYVCMSDFTEPYRLSNLVRLHRDFYRFLCNFVTFRDFYDPSRERKAVFQCGTLFIDSRSCDLCIKVSDMDRHNATSDLGGLFLLYCECHRPGETMTIVAAVTDGDINSLSVGKNAIFYDRAGREWDAVVIKVVDKPISLRQAFFSPYRKLGKFVSESIEKFSVSSESKVIGDIENTKIKEKQSFDIAKFAGIFAVIGMALGTVAGFLLDLFSKFFSLTVLQMVGVIFAIVIIISGPAMLKAWLSLRKRNISPLLNANGWAVNCDAIVNVRFGETLTSIAKLPLLKSKDDPFADKKIPLWKKLLSILVLLALIGGAAYFYFYRWRA